MTSPTTFANFGPRGQPTRGAFFASPRGWRLSLFRILLATNLGRARGDRQVVQRGYFDDLAPLID